MCVIAFSPKGIDIPDEDTLRQMWASNPDGAGYAYTDKNGRVSFSKGFMSLEELLDDLKDPSKFKNTNFAIHFRIGTSGKNDAKTCHPFPVSDNFYDLTQTKGTADAVLFHNGILGEGGLSSPLASDTQDFVIAYAPIFATYTKNIARDNYINSMIDSSKLLILYDNNRFKMYGKWEKDGEIWVSNLNYKFTYTWTGDYSDRDGWWDDWYADYYAKKENTQPDDEATIKMWEKIIKQRYDYITPEELATLKQSADDYTRDTLEYSGYTFGYDTAKYGDNKTDILVWLEDEPKEYEKE